MSIHLKPNLSDAAINDWERAKAAILAVCNRPTLTLDMSTQTIAVAQWRKAQRAQRSYSLAMQHNLSRQDRTLTTKQQHKLRRVK